MYFPDLPTTFEIKKNLKNEIGDLAVFYYRDSNLYHYAKVTWTDGYYFNIIESNYHSCKETERVLNTDYPHLIGFWSS